MSTLLKASPADQIDPAPAPSKAKPSKLYSIQYLRAIAALMVVVHHSLGQSLGGHPSFYGEGPLRAGVDIFFVVSGFVMVFVTAKGENTARQFMERRIIRIIPVYWFYTIMAAVLFLLAPNLFRNSQLSARHFLLSLFFIPHVASDGSMSPLVRQGWTLNYEMFFYLVFTIAIALSQRSRVALSVGLLAFLVLLGLTPYPAAMHAWLLGHPAVAFNTGPIMLEFGMGMILGAVYLRGGLKSLNKPVSILLIVAGAIVMLASSPDDLLRPIQFGLPALAMVTGALSLEAHGLVGLHKGLLRVGDASYSVYLVHIFPIAVLRWAWSRAHLGHSVWMYIPFVLASMAIAIACGLGSYLAVEKPSLSYLRRWIS